MAAKYIAPAFALAGSAVAAVCSTDGTLTITNTVQASGLATCQTFTGDIAIATSANEAIALDGVQRIKGSLIANKVAHLPGLSGSTLDTIDDDFMLNDCPALTDLTFPALTTVGDIKWVGLAGLSSLAFSQGIQTATNVVIDNTNLGSLDGINLKEVGGVALTNNRFLNQISMQLDHITTGLIISANGRDVDLSLPNLIWANSLTIQNASAINLDSLSYVNGSLYFISNFVDSISLDNLTQVGKSLAINGNAELTKVSMSELTQITGGLSIQNNTGFTDMDGFDKLATIGGGVVLDGSFSTVSLPGLKTVKGGMTVKSTKNIQSECNHFKSINGATSVIQGTLTCTSNDDGANTAGGSPSTSSGAHSSSSSTPSSSSGAANAVHVSGVTGVLGVVAAIFGML